MRVPKTSPSRPQAGRAYARSVFRAASTIRLVVAATGLALSIYPVKGQDDYRLPPQPAVDASRYGEDAKYDCSVDERIDVKSYSQRAVQDGIEGAYELLARCAACRDFFRDSDPVQVLKVLAKEGRIVVTDQTPTYIPPPGWPRGLIQIKTFEAIELEMAKQAPKKSKGQTGSDGPKIFAAAVDLYPVTRGSFLQPCIYVNSKRYVGSDPSHYVERSNLRHLRALALLHELAHILNSIPPDVGHTAKSRRRAVKRSEKNQLCIDINCDYRSSSSCPAESVACDHRPKPPKSKRRGKAASSSTRQRRQP